MNIQEDDLKSSLPEEVTGYKDEIKTSNLSQNDLNVEKVKEENKSAVYNSIDPMEVPLNNQNTTFNNNITNENTLDAMEIPLNSGKSETRDQFSSEREFPDGAIPGEESSHVKEKDERPMIERLNDGNWKLRVDAYKDLISTLNQNDGDKSVIVIELYHLLPKMVSEKNLAALDAGLDCAKALLKMCDASHEETLVGMTHSIVKYVIDQAAPGRASTQTKGKQVILALMETTDAEGISEYLLGRLNDKKAKIPVVILDLLQEALSAFGVGAGSVSVKQVISALIGSKSPLQDAKNAAARESALNLVAELHRWLGAVPLNPLKEGLKPAQLEVLETKIKAQVGRATPSIWLRKHRPIGFVAGEESQGVDAGSISVDANSNASAGASAPVLNVKDFMQEVDLIAHMKKGEYSKLIKEEKWSQQLEALQIVENALVSPVKMKPLTSAGLSALSTPIKTMLRGSGTSVHIQLQLSSMRVLALLAEGLEADREFCQVARSCTQNIVLKSKERRCGADVVKCLTSLVQWSISYDGMCEDVAELLKNKKSPSHCRTALLELMMGVAASHSHKMNSDSLKSCADVAAAAAEDSDPVVRDKAQNVLSCLLPVCKSRIEKEKDRVTKEALQLLMNLEQSNPRAFKRMMEGPVASATASTSTTASSSTLDTTKSKAKGNSVTTKVRGSSKSPIRNSIKSTKSESSSTSSIADAETQKHNPLLDPANDRHPSEHISLEDSVETLALVGVEDWITKKNMIESDKWQEKVELLEMMSQALKTSRVGGKVSTAMVVWLSAKFSNLKISNTTVLKAVVSVLTAAVTCMEGDDKFNPDATALLLKVWVDKMGDRKMNSILGDFYTHLAENLGFAFVAVRLCEALKSVKSPVAIEFFLTWCQKTVQELGVSGLPMKEFATFIVSHLEHKIGGIRTGAVALCGICYSQVGPRYRSVINGVLSSNKNKSSLLSLVEAEFERVGFDPVAAAAICAKRGNQGTSDKASTSGDGRVDIMTLLDKNCMSEIAVTEGKDSWQKRKVAIESIITACEKSCNYMEGNKSALEVAKALKTRMCKDTQANLKPLAVSALGSLLAALPSEASIKVLRVVASGLLAGTGENKKSMRDATVTALNMVVKSRVGCDADRGVDEAVLMVLIGPTAEALINPVGRLELLEWLCDHESNHGLGSSQGDCDELVAPLVLAMQDKTAAVRSKAEKLMLSLANRMILSRSVVDKATRDLAPATMRTLQGVISKVMGVLGDSSVSSAVSDMTGGSTTTNGTRTSMSRHSTSPIPRPTRVTEKEKDKNISISSSSVVSNTETPVTKAVIISGTESSSNSINTNSETVEVSSSTSSGWHLRKTSKTRRLEDFHKLNWPSPPADPGTVEWSTLKGQWEPLLTPELSTLLFPESKHGPGLGASSSAGTGVSLSMEAVTPALPVLLSQFDCPHMKNHLDLLLRWLACSFSLRETSVGLLNLLEFTENLLVQLAVMTPGFILHEAECVSLLPLIIERAGHKSERHRVAFKSCLAAAAEIVTHSRLCQLLLAGLGCKNKKTRVVCLEQVQRLVESSGASVLGRAGMKELGSFLESRDNDLAGRNSCLELIYSLYCSLGNDFQKVIKALGAGASGSLGDRARVMIEDRIKQKLRTGVVPVNSASPNNAKMEKMMIQISSPKSGSSSVSQETLTESPEVNPFQLQMTPPGEERSHSLGGFSTVSKTKSKLRFTMDAPTPQFYGDARSRGTVMLDASGTGVVANKVMTDVDGSLAFNLPQTPMVKSTFHDDDDDDEDHMTNSIGSDTSSTTGIVAGNVSLARGIISKDSNTTYHSSTTKMEDASVGKEATTTVSAGVELTENQHVRQAVAASLDALLVHEDVVDRSHELHQNARESLKVLHTIIRNGNGDVLDAPTCRRVVACLRRSFDAPSTCTVEVEPNAFTESALTVDWSLASVTLAVLFAAIRCDEGAVVRSFSTSTLEDIFQECLIRIVDPRLNRLVLSNNDNTFVPSAEAEDATQILKALNLILLNLAALCGLADVISVLLRCLLKADDSSSSDTGEVRLSRDICAPISRLLHKICKAPHPSSNALKMTGVRQESLAALHHFLEGHPIAKAVAEQDSFQSYHKDREIESGVVNVTLKIAISLLQDVVTTAGKYETLETLRCLHTSGANGEGGIPHDALLFRACFTPALMGDSFKVPSWYTSSNRNVMSNRSHVAMQDRENVGNFDVSSSSSSDTDSGHGNGDINISKDHGHGLITKTSLTSQSLDLSTSETTATETKLFNKVGDVPMPSMASSPRAALQKNVLSSLSSLSRSLDLGGMGVTVPENDSSSNNSNSNSEGSIHTKIESNSNSSSSSSAMAGFSSADSDLAARLNRLRNRHMQ